MPNPTLTVRKDDHRELPAYLAPTTKVDPQADRPPSGDRPRPQLVVTNRDRAIIDTATRMGAVTSTALHQLHAPTTDPHTFRRRLRRLAQARLLRATGHAGPGRIITLITVGPAALAPGQPRPWTPSLGQLAHTLAVEQTLLQLLSPRLAAGLTVTGWQGEAELRGWERPGHPRPDLRAHWLLHRATDDAQAGRGELDVEVDRGTEAGPAWRRKLARYLTHTPDATVLAVTTSDQRARNIAETAHSIGVDLLALPTAKLAEGGDPVVYDTRGRRRHSLSAALPQTANTATTQGTR